MKSWLKVVTLGIAVLVFASAAAPAFAAEMVDVRLDNRGTAQVFLTLKGPMKESLTVARGISNVELTPGVYDYRYTSCGRTVRGTFTVGPNGGSLIIKKCPGSATSRIVLNNKTGNPFVLTLTGTNGTFGFYIPVGGANISVPAGGYAYTSSACGDGNGRVKASTTPQVWTWTCSKITLVAK
jgi:hypothetical protein